MKKKLTAVELKAPIKEQLSHIVDCIKSALEKLHPELCADIYDFGMTVSGGGALLDGIDKYLSSIFGFEVKCAESPLDCCVEGIEKIVELFPSELDFNE